jgi:hypothetical protein
LLSKKWKTNKTKQQTFTFKEKEREQRERERKEEVPLNQKDQEGSNKRIKKRSKRTQGWKKGQIQREADRKKEEKEDGRLRRR